MGILKILQKCTEFEWDMHNAGKNWQKHRVMPAECEQIFFNRPLVVADDVAHSVSENRFYALGQTDDKRMLFAVFTIRLNRVRVISARDMSRKEREAYRSHEKDSEI
jgi:hypothetical protein